MYTKLHTVVFYFNGLTSWLYIVVMSFLNLPDIDV